MGSSLGRRGHWGGRQEQGEGRLPPRCPGPTPNGGGPWRGSPCPPIPWCEGPFHMSSSAPRTKGKESRGRALVCHLASCSFPERPFVTVPQRNSPAGETADPGCPRHPFSGVGMEKEGAAQMALVLVQSAHSGWSSCGSRVATEAHRVCFLAGQVPVSVDTAPPQGGSASQDAGAWTADRSPPVSGSAQPCPQGARGQRPNPLPPLSCCSWGSPHSPGVQDLQAPAAPLELGRTGSRSCTGRTQADWFSPLCDPDGAWFPWAHLIRRLPSFQVKWKMHERIPRRERDGQEGPHPGGQPSSRVQGL